MNLDPRISQALIEAVDTRVDQHERARPYTAYGVVASVDRTTQKASVYVSGDTVPSLGFHFPLQLYPDVGMRVRVVIDPRGDRYIDAIPDPANDTPKIKHGGYLDVYRDTGGGRSFLRGFIEGEAFPRTSLGIDPDGDTVLQGGDGTAGPTTFLERTTAGAVLLNGFGRLRFVPLATQIQVANGSTTTSATDVAITSAELTALPSGIVKAVYGHIIVVNTTADGYAHISNYDATQSSNIVYVSAASKNASTAFLVAPGGTNNRQVKYTVRATTGTLTYYIRITGYFTDDN